MYNTQYFVDFVKEQSPKTKTLVVACPHDEGSISSLCKAYSLGIINPILVGNREQIEEVAHNGGYDISNFKIIDANTLEEAAELTVEQVANGNAEMIMKGLIDTSILLKAVLKKEYGLRTGRQFSHIGCVFKEDSDRYYLITDAGMNISPTLEEKKQIIENSVELAHALGNKNPNVALLCAKEKPYEKMPATIDAAALQEMNQNGQITGCVVSGPLQLDNAVSEAAAKQKGIKDPAAGKADVLIVPNIEVGNVLVKALKYLGDYTFAGVVMGSKVPIVMVSRADGEKEKLMSIALACALSEKGENNNG